MPLFSSSMQERKIKWFILIVLSCVASHIAAQRDILHFKDGPEEITALHRQASDASTVFKSRRYVILQFSGIPPATVRRMYEERGVVFLHYIPDHAYYVSMPADLEAGSTLSAIPIRSILPLKAQHKVSAALEERRSVAGKMRVLFAGDLNDEDIQEILTDFGYDSAEKPFPGFPLVEITADDAMITALSNHPAIVWLDIPPGEDVAHRYVAVKNERVEALYRPEVDLQGTGVKIGVGDAGKVGDHIDLNSQVTNYSPYFINFHPTHVTGIITGRPNLNPREGQGVAPDATVVTAYFSQIIVEAERFITDHQIVITNNSYGSSLGSCVLAGDYNLSSIFIDDQLNTHDSLLHVFSAGNDGGLTCSPYPQRFHTVATGWQSAKNPLVVGMLDHGDAINNSSSRGPADDGRLKPEIMAVGTERRSTRHSNTYGGGSGTSYSAPGITGISALLYEAYKDEHGVFPDAALIKGILLNTADDLGNAGPDFSYGYGRVNAKRAYDALVAETRFNNAVDQDDQLSFMINVPASTAELRVMLLWKDPSAAPYAAPALVNDLDLLVTNPTAVSFKPWVLNPTPAGCTQLAIRSIDDKNPQEQVTIANPAPGMYTLTVTGSEVPFGPQDFYCFYEIVPHKVQVVYPNGGESLVTGETEWIRWDATGNAIQVYTVEYQLHPDSAWTMINNNVLPALRLASFIVPANVTDQFRVRVTGGAFQDISDNAALILGVPTGFIHTSPCRGYAQMTWNTVSGADHYAIYKLTDGWMVQVGTTSATNYLISGLDPSIREWYSVAAVHASEMQSRRATARSILATGSLQCTWMNDVSIDAMIEPIDGRKFTSTALGAADTVTVTVRNSGSNSVSNVPISFRVNNGSIHSGIIAGPLAAGASVSHEFQTAVNLSTPGNYNIEVWTALAGDTHTGNDSISHLVRHVANTPVILPWIEGFETADEMAISKAQFAVPGLERCDFEYTYGTGRLRTHAGGDFVADGSRALTLDAVEYDSTSTNEVEITVNMSAYDTLTDDVRLTFNYMHHVLVSEGNTMNRLWIRGNDLAAWIEMLNFDDLIVARGEHLSVFPELLITDSLKHHDQDFSSSFQLRFAQQGDGSADNVIMEDGYTIDNLHLFAVTNDLRIVSVSHPQELSCGLGVEQISVVIENTSNIMLSNIDVAFQIEGNGVVTEEIASIPAGATITYEFTGTFNFSEDTTYAIHVWLNHPSDSYSLNDSIRVDVIQSISIASFPYLEDFEEGDGGWYAQGTNSTLEFGTPRGAFISKAASGTQAWVTNLDGNHNDDETSYLISPCFDLTTLTNPVLSFSHIYETEVDFDFHWVEYTTDGIEWTKLGTTSAGVNWYNNTSPQSWDGISDSWHVASIALPAEESRLQIRFVFISDVGVTEEGFGIDDVHIHEDVSIYAGANLLNQAYNVSGADWVWIDKAGKRIMGIHPMGQNLGPTNISIYQSNTETTAVGQAWILDKSWILQPTNSPASPVKVRLFFTEADYDALQLEASQIGNGCPDCISLTDVYELEGWKYSGANEDNTLANNTSGVNTYYQDDKVLVVPYDSGYYAEITIASLSELWLTGPRIRYVDSVFYKVTASSDDAEEYALTGSVNPISPILEISETPDSQTVGLRFRNIEIPDGSFIEEAYLQFTAAGNDVLPAVMTVLAEEPVSTNTYNTRHFNVTSRGDTEQRQTWNIASWNTGNTGVAQRSTDLRALVQELVDGTWTPGNPIAFTITGNGNRRAWSVDGDAELAPVLHIRYDSVCSRTGVLFVNPAATGFGTGESWTNAFTDLQHALDLAKRCPDAKEIWVKAGTYKTAFFPSFFIASGIQLYGGFNGTETLRTQRNPSLNPTILSGDIGVVGSITDNNNHVVHILAGTDTSVVDGFAIVNGNAQTTVNKGGGIFSEGHCILRNLAIIGCHSIGGGSAIAHRGSGNVMWISNSVLQNNTGIDLLNEIGAVMRVDEGSVLVE